MFRIGVFARLGEVSVRTLRFYDERGLIKPARIDAQTGYRYYNAAQIPHLLQILALRDLGFTLDEIAIALQKSLAPDAFLALLRSKRDTLRERLQRDSEILARIEARLTDLSTKGKTMSTLYEVALKPVPSVLVASVRGTVPTWDMTEVTLNGLFDTAFAYVESQGGTRAGAPFDRWLDEEMKNADMSVEVCVPVAQSLPESGNARTYEMPGATLAAWTIYTGHFSGMGAAHRETVEWIERNGYRIAGAVREISLVYERGGDPSKWVTEIQYPVEKV